MAIKAGLVGVNPKGVDKNGMPIGSGDVSETQLTANGKKFFFAYDSTSEKYGYKLDGTGEFIPFEVAGGGPGWVKPANLDATGITYTNCELYSGGVYIDNGIVYVDIIVKRTSGSVAAIANLPHVASGLLFLKTNTVEPSDIYIPDTTATYNATYSNFAISSGTKDRYAHVWGEITEAI